MNFIKKIGLIFALCVMTSSTELCFPASPDFEREVKDLESTLVYDESLFSTKAAAINFLKTNWQKLKKSFLKMKRDEQIGWSLTGASGFLLSVVAFCNLCSKAPNFTPPAIPPAPNPEIPNPDLITIPEERAKSLPRPRSKSISRERSTQNPRNKIVFSQLPVAITVDPALDNPEIDSEPAGDPAALSYNPMVALMPNEFIELTIDNKLISVQVWPSSWPLPAGSTQNGFLFVRDLVEGEKLYSFTPDQKWIELKPNPVAIANPMLPENLPFSSESDPKIAPQQNQQENAQFFQSLFENQPNRRPFEFVVVKEKKDQRSWAFVYQDRRDFPIPVEKEQFAILRKNVVGENGDLKKIECLFEVEQGPSTDLMWKFIEPGQWRLFDATDISNQRMETPPPYFPEFPQSSSSSSSSSSLFDSHELSVSLFVPRESDYKYITFIADPGTCHKVQVFSFKVTAPTQENELACIMENGPSGPTFPLHKSRKSEDSKDFIWEKVDANDYYFGGEQEVPLPSSEFLPLVSPLSHQSEGAQNLTLLPSPAFLPLDGLNIVFEDGFEPKLNRISIYKCFNVEPSTVPVIESDCEGSLLLLSPINNPYREKPVLVMCQKESADSEKLVWRKYDGNWNFADPAAVNALIERQRQSLVPAVLDQFLPNDFAEMPSSLNPSQTPESVFQRELEKNVFFFNKKKKEIKVLSLLKDQFFQPEVMTGDANGDFLLQEIYFDDPAKPHEYEIFKCEQDEESRQLEWNLVPRDKYFFEPKFETRALRRLERRNSFIETKLSSKEEPLVVESNKRPRSNSCAVYSNPIVPTPILGNPRIQINGSQEEMEIPFFESLLNAKIHNSVKLGECFLVKTGPGENSFVLLKLIEKKALSWTFEEFNADQWNFVLPPSVAPSMAEAQEQSCFVVPDSTAQQVVDPASSSSAFNRFSSPSSSSSSSSVLTEEVVDAPAVERSFLDQTEFNQWSEPDAQGRRFAKVNAENFFKEAQVLSPKKGDVIIFKSHPCFLPKELSWNWVKIVCDGTESIGRIKELSSFDQIFA